jgi:hypothetical protein
MAHPSRLWLDKWLPVIGGRLLGFPKRLSRMDIDATGYAARSFLFGIPIFSAHYGLTGEPGRPASFANYAAIAPIFEQPFVQQMLCLYPTVSLAMQWLMADATMQALNMTLDVHGGADPGIPPGTYQVEGIDQQVLGGFRLTVNWRMPSPKLMR